MRIAVCDDDAKTRTDYSIMINAIAHRKGINLQISEYETGRQLQFALAGPEEPPDIIMLDILMPGADGIEIGQWLRSAGYRGVIIYLSHSPDYMQSAFDVGAFNYILKSYENADLIRFEKVLAQAMDKVQMEKGKSIVLSGKSEHRNLIIESILYFESLKHIITVHYGEGETFEFAGTLVELERELSPYGFVRTHRSYLVNSIMVARFNYEKLWLVDRTEIPISRKRYPVLKAAIKANAVANIDNEK